MAIHFSLQQTNFDCGKNDANYVRETLQWKRENVQINQQKYRDWNL